MTSAEEPKLALQVRIEELDALAPYVPPNILAQRLLHAALTSLESRGFSTQADALAERFEDEAKVPKFDVSVFTTQAVSELEEISSVFLEEPEEPEESEELKKECTKCGDPKPLSAFNKQPTGLHGRRASCRDCDTAKKRERYQSGKATGQEEAKLPPSLPSTEVRRCANGLRCAAVDGPFGEPSILQATNSGPLCRKCQKRAGLSG